MGDTTDVKKIENSTKNAENNQEETTTTKTTINDGGDKEELIKIKARTPRNQSDIFSLNEAKNDFTSDLYSFRGVPTKSKLQQQQQQQEQQQRQQQQQDNESVLTNASTSSKMSRNPLTGLGVCSNDEFISKPIKRRDGNPVLGSGYIDDVDNDNKKQMNSTRIPPGGHSHGIW